MLLKFKLEIETNKFEYRFGNKNPMVQQLGKFISGIVLIDVFYDQEMNNNRLHKTANSIGSYIVVVT